MKKLILASIASNIIHKTEFVFDKPFNEVRLAVIPTAANGETGDKSWLQVELDLLKKLGFQTKVIQLEGKTEPELQTELSAVDAIFVCGGNTYYLLDHVRRSGFDKVVLELVDRGIVYIGSSAGALLACPTIDIARRFDDHTMVELTDYSGLGLIDSVILPHIDQKKYLEDFLLTIDEWKDKDYDLVGLTDSQGLIVRGNYTEFIDVGTQ